MEAGTATGAAAEAGADGPARGEPGCVATVGSFDGVHLGHLELLSRVAGRARSRGLAGLLVTFDRHPLSVVRPSEAPALLTTLEEKKEVVATTPVRRMAVLPFTPALSRYPPEAYVREVLVGRLGVRELVIGPDHGFGRSRSGDVETLRRLRRTLELELEVVDDVTVRGEAVSSTRVRRLLGEGRLRAANRALGRPYALRARVGSGLGRGRELGFPTANLGGFPPDKLLPREGIYAVRASLRTGPREGLVHLGPRPTFPDAPPSVELHLLDFEGDLYDEGVKVEFLHRLRDIRAFPSADALVAEMERDRERAIAFFRRRDALQAPPEDL